MTIRAFFSRFSRILCVLLMVAVGACASPDEKPYVEKPPEQLYEEALKALREKNYQESARLFDEVERQHPYSQWASKAQLMAAYAYYQNLQYADAINTLDRFIQIHPGHQDIAYAYYMRALCYYEQISDVGRDQSDTEKAMEALREVSRRFPDTKYARDAALKLGLTNDHLAGKEMEIGRYYQSQQQYIASLGRFRKVIEDYQTTSHVPEALHRLVETYLAIGIPREAQTAAAVLGYNFPGSPWYQESYKLLGGRNLKPQADQGSWLSRQFNKIM
jgi:outer membrane protein assembly factor BamD